MPAPAVPRSGQVARQLSWTAVLLSFLLLLMALMIRVITPQDSTQFLAAAPLAERVAPAAAALLPPGFSQPVATTPQAAPPVELAIPVVKIQSRLVGLRLNNDGSVQVPTDYAAAGWYADGAAPGDAGPPAVLVGHVDSSTGPGVFFRLPQVRVGDAVLIRSADGRVLRFVVYAAQNFTKKSFPSQQVYAPAPTPELRLITCTGVFDRRSGHYESNLVLSARLAPATQEAAHT